MAKVLPYWNWDGGDDHPELKKYDAFRQKLRKVVDEHLIPHVSDWDEAGDFPRSLHHTLYKAGLYGMGWPKEYGGQDPAPLNAWQQYIFYDETSRVGTGGLYASLFTMGIGLPPIIKASKPEIQTKIVPDIICGKKTIALAITEPGGGSDVANMQTTAKLSDCKKFYIVNGSKTFISGGYKADYLTLGVKTKDDGGHAGLSLLLVACEGTAGIKRTRLKTQGWWSSNTTTIALEDVKVPVENLIGNENEGFLYIMHNFNQERRAIAVMSNRFSRICLEDAISYAKKRKTFGKPLISHQVIRHKIAEMIRMILATHGMVLRVHHKVYEVGDDNALSGEIALLKVQATKTLEFCAREASQILGGKSYLREGPGSRIERIYREVRVAAIGGGSEEVMLDLAFKQARL